MSKPARDNCPPLITPSASPPPHPTSSSHNNALPPSKRQRMSSVSRSSSLRRSASATESVFDIQKEREASRTRLLGTWSQLAERYSRRLDEDDIVDIRTGEIVKDNGFWRSTRKFNFGEALESEEGDTVDDESEGEEGVDELDAFCGDHDYLEDIFARGLQQRCTNENHDIADDLDEFLEAEQRRREDYGSDLEEAELELSDTNRDRSRSPLSPAMDDDSDGGGEEQNDIDDPPATTSPVYESTQEEFASDSDELNDELDNWEPTEASMVVVTSDARHSSPPGDESESDVEVIEPFALAHRSVPPKQRTPPVHLHTPPRSHSFVDPPIFDRVVSPLRLPSSQHPVDTTPDTGARIAPSTPPKTRARTSGIQPSRARAPTPEVIELTDDELPKPGASQLTYSPSPSPLPPPSFIRARSRGPSIVPQVVISTLPPRLDQTKHAGGTTTPEPKATPSVKRTKRPTSTETSVHTPHITKPTPHPKPSRSMKKSNKLTELRAIIRPTAAILYEDQEAPKSDIPREISPEIGERPITPAPSASRPPSPRASESPPKKWTSHKRKRSSPEHETIIPERVQMDPLPAKPRKTTKGRSSSTVPRSSSRRSLTRSKYILSDDGGHSSLDENAGYPRRPWRSTSVSTSSHMQPPYTPHTPSHQVGMYPPIADPRAQQIVTQAMHQLAVLLWTPTHSSPAGLTYPYTPNHQRFSSVGPTFMHSTPDHPHPYPFSFNPSLSRATLPPSSPEPPSSPVKPRERRKSLVSRSHSRGRRVSFHVDNLIRSEEEPLDSPLLESLNANIDRQHLQKGRARSPLQPKSKGKGKGKGKAVARHVTPSESEPDDDSHSEEETGVQLPRASSPERRPKSRSSTVLTLSSSFRPRSSKKGSRNG